MTRISQKSKLTTSFVLFCSVFEMRMKGNLSNNMSIVYVLRKFNW